MYTRENRLESCDPPLPVSGRRGSRPLGDRMSIEIRVPQLGESLTEATVGRWLKKEGDAVTEGEPVVELETEKVNMEVPATASGILSSIVKQEGDAASVDEVLATMETDQGTEAPQPPREAAPAQQSASQSPAEVPTRA